MDFLKTCPHDRDDAVCSAPGCNHLLHNGNPGQLARQDAACPVCRENARNPACPYGFCEGHQPQVVGTAAHCINPNEN